jgi:sRNA-binding carbon storage regulator CsrA
VGKSILGAKVGVVAPVGVVLRRMEVVSLLRFATATSGEPSPLKSPMLTDQGPSPVGKSTLGAKVGVVAPVGVVLMRMEVVLLKTVRHSYIWFPVAVEVADADMNLGNSPVGSLLWGRKWGWWRLWGWC